MTDGGFAMLTPKQQAAQKAVRERLAAAEGQLTAVGKAKFSKTEQNDKPVSDRLLKSAGALIPTLKTDFKKEEYAAMRTKIGTWQQSNRNDVASLQVLIGQGKLGFTPVSVLVEEINRIKVAAEGV